MFAATAQDRQLRAYDRDNGNVLWSYTLPGGSEGIPATYELDGRQYLAVPVAAGAGLFAPLLDPAPSVPPLERAYVVFALPRGSEASGERVEELLLTPPQCGVGKSAERRAEVVVDVLGPTRARNRARHGRVRDDVLQEELPPLVASNSAAKSGSCRPSRTSKIESRPPPNGTLIMTAMPRSAAVGNSRSAARRSPSE